MKAFLALLLCALVASVSAQSGVTLKNGVASFTGTSGLNVASFPQSVDMSSILNTDLSGSNVVSVTANGTGHVWLAVSGSLNSNCVNSYGSGVVSNAELRLNGVRLDAVGAPSGPSTTQFNWVSNGRLVKPGDKFDVVVTHTYNWGTASSCTSSLSDVRMTLGHFVAL